MRKIYGLPEVVIFDDDEVSTSIGTLYSISFGITASVAVDAEAPMSTGTFVTNDELLGHPSGFRRIALGIFDDEFKLLTEHAAFSVDLVDGNFSAIDDVGAGRRESARKRLHQADLNRGLRGGAADQTQCKDRDCRGLSDYGIVAFHLKSSTSSSQSPSSRTLNIPHPHDIERCSTFPDAVMYR
jgi:hypothetical protein